MRVSRSALKALRIKYVRLIDLRAEREQAEAEGRLRINGQKAEVRLRLMRDVAKEFPGALKELDYLDLVALRERLAEVEACLGSTERKIPIWLGGIWHFHCVVRCMQAIKQHGCRSNVTEEEWKYVQVSLREKFAKNEVEGLVELVGR